MAGVIRVVLAIVTVACSVHSQDWTDGCVVERGLRRTVFERTVTMLLAEPLDQRLQVVAPGPKANCTLNVTLGHSLDPLPVFWTPATLVLYPRLELRMAGRPALSTACAPLTPPTFLVMNNVLALTHCPQGKSIWRLTPSDKSLTFEVGESERFSIVSSEEVEFLAMRFDQETLFLCMQAGEAPYLHKGRKCPASRGLKAHLPLNLHFILSDTDYQILGNGARLRSQRWKTGRSKILEFTNKKKNNTSSVYVAHQLPVRPQDEAHPMSVLVAVLAVLVLVLAAVCVALLLSLLRHSTALSGYVLWRRGHAGCEVEGGPEGGPEGGHEGHSGPLAASSIYSTGKTWPHPPPRPPNTLVSPENDGAEPPVDAPIDVQAEYVKAKDVSPIEVTILKQQNIILGQISHQVESSSPWSLARPSSRTSIDVSRRPSASRRQSQPNTTSNNNIKMQATSSVSGGLSGSSDIYETVDDTVDADGYFRLGEL